MTALNSAIRALEARKQAACDQDKSDGPRHVDSEQLRRLLIGLDLDYEELIRVAADFGAQAAMLIESGIHPGVVAGSAWTDGLITGWLLAELQGKEISEMPSGDDWYFCSECGAVTPR